MLYLNKILHNTLKEGFFPFLSAGGYLSSPLQSVFPRGQGRMGEKTMFCKSFWLHVKCRMEMSLSVFNFFFLYGLWCSSEDPCWKKKLKTGNSNFVRRFTCNQIDLKLNDFLSHYCHLMMEVPLKILFLLKCLARQKMLFGSRHVLNIFLNSRLYGPH